MRNHSWLCLAALGSVFMMVGSLSVGAADTSWRDAVYQTTLKNQFIEAKFQAGFLYQLTRQEDAAPFLSISPASLPAEQPVFGPHSLNLDQCRISQQSADEAITTMISAPDGSIWQLHWSLDGQGDLILRTSAQTAKPVDQMRMIFPGCDIQRHTLVAICAYGVARPYKAPWQDTFNNVSTADYSRSFNHPLVALFEGDKPGGWFVEGREPRIGPANLGIQGRGNSADLYFVRGYAVEPTKNPELFEIRFRTYSQIWADAVDPYLEWMEKTAGYVPIDKGGHHPAWVQDIKLQSYFRVGELEPLDMLAQRFDPRTVLVGRNVGHRKFRMDYHYPNYEFSDSAKQWIRHARELGFHVGAHFNTSGVGKTQPELVKRFRKGFLVTGKDEKGNETYFGVDGPTRHYYCSPALKEWRDYFIEQIKEAVEAGIDLIYLDESMAPSGAYVVDSMTGVQGTIALMEEIKKAYPGVAIETEQFNTMSAFRSDFALSQMPLGHPLSGYLFSKFIKIVPEGLMGTPTDTEYAEAFFHWAFMLPSAQILQTQSWLDIDQAYFDYRLQPDPRLPYDRPISYQNHFTHGVIPLYGDRETIRYFGLRGKNNLTAYFEKQGSKRGLILYETDKPPRWIVARYTNLTEWNGPGGIQNWLLYNGDKLMALNPQKSYGFSDAVIMPPDRFHIAAIPDDFKLHFIEYLDYAKECHQGQEVGQDDSYFKVRFHANGRLSVYVPGDYLLFINGQPIAVDPQSHLAAVTVAADAAALDKQEKLNAPLVKGVDQMVTAAAFREENDPSGKTTYTVLQAFRQNDTPLSGKWSQLPWQVPPKQRSWHLKQHQLYEATADGPALMIRDGDGFFNHVTGRGIIIGRFPNAEKIRMEGGYHIREDSFEGAIAGKVWINGKEVLRIPGSDKRPFELQHFDVDITEFAGQYAMVEFGVEGVIRGNVADWITPQFIAENGK